MTTTSRIRAVGNSKGVILPKKFLDQCGIEGRVNISIKDKMITIVAARNSTKKKWADFRPASNKPKVVLIPNTFDDKDWTW